MFVVDAAKPGGAVVQIGLVSGGAAVVDRLGTKLNSRVRARVARDAIFEVELEVMYLLFIENELVSS